MNTKTVLIIGATIAASAVLFDLLGQTFIAKVVFVVGMVVGLLGVGYMILRPPESEGSNRWELTFFRMSLAGFMVAAISLLTEAFVFSSEVTEVLFTLGGVVFVAGAILPALLSVIRSLDE